MSINPSADGKPVYATDLVASGRSAERDAILSFLRNRADWLEGQPGYASAADDYRFMAMKIERGDHLKAKP